MTYPGTRLPLHSEEPQVALRHQEIEEDNNFLELFRPDIHCAMHKIGPLYLASKASDFVTGTAIPVDGGYAIRQHLLAIATRYLFNFKLAFQMRSEFLISSQTMF